MQKYGVQLRILHWLMFICFSMLFVLGFFMTEFKESEPWHLYSLHKSLGVLVFLLLLLRWFTRLTGKIPPPASYMTDKDEKIARVTQYLMYFFMLFVPVTGYIMSNIHGHKVLFFGLQLPTFFAENPELQAAIHQAHEYSSYIFLAIIVVHILGVVKHHAQSNEILRRIT